VPTDYRLWFHDEQYIRPSRPNLPQDRPKQTIQAVQCRPRPFPFEDSNLLPQGKDFQRQIGPTTEEGADGRQECRYDAEHDSTFVATRHSRLRTESQRADFYQYEHLATHSRLWRLHCGDLANQEGGHASTTDSRTRHRPA